MKPWDRYPERHKARVAVRLAVKRGQLIRPSVCQSCQSADLVQAHHEDYNKPLDIQWLCSACHRRADMARRMRHGIRRLNKVSVQLDMGVIDNLRPHLPDLNASEIIRYCLEVVLGRGDDVELHREKAKFINLRTNE